jgi:hypothetical protein
VPSAAARWVARADWCGEPVGSPRHMGRNDNPWQQVAALAGIAALAGAGVGAGSALMFAERRAAAQDRELESLTRRVTMLERLSERVTKLERGSRSPASRSEAS